MGTKHLLENGHQRIACIQGVPESVPNKLRIKGYKDAMIGAGITDYQIIGDEFSVQNGYKEMKLLLQTARATDCNICIK